VLKLATKALGCGVRGVGGNPKPARATFITIWMQRLTALNRVDTLPVVFGSQSRDTIVWIATRRKQCRGWCEAEALSHSSGGSQWIHLTIQLALPIEAELQQGLIDLRPD
jgi:hypothetical protein